MMGVLYVDPNLVIMQKFLCQRITLARRISKIIYNAKKTFSMFPALFKIMGVFYFDPNRGLCNLFLTAFYTLSDHPRLTEYP